MATKSQRTMAAILALLFLLSSIATTGYVIWQINSEEPVATGQEEEASLDADTPPTGSQGQPLGGFTPRAEPVAALESTDTAVGNGAEATASSTVTVHYTLAAVSDGLIIESSLDSGEPLTQPLSGLIVGWQQGVPGMKVGGKRRLVVPASLAYGDADLVFDIELLAVE